MWNAVWIRAEPFSPANLRGRTEAYLRIVILVRQAGSIHRGCSFGGLEISVWDFSLGLAGWGRGIGAGTGFKVLDWCTIQAAILWN